MTIINVPTTTDHSATDIGEHPAAGVNAHHILSLTERHLDVRTHDR
jgi:hypothetical protein